MRISQPATKLDIFLYGPLFLILMIVFGACPAYDIVRDSYLTPPETARSFDEFLRWRPGIQRFAITTLEGAEYLEAEGPRTSMMSSGPCRYTFDGQGTMVYYTTDSGDGGYYETWKGTNRRSVTREEARRFVQQ